MALLGFLPGSKSFLRVAGKELDKVERKSENLHNAFMPVAVRDDEVDYDSPHSYVGRLIEQFKDQLETALVLLSRLPAGALATKLTNQVTELCESIFLSFSVWVVDESWISVYYDLPHPPATYMGDQYRFRMADGSYNNVDEPDLGKANTPYCRSVQAQHPLSAAELPDPQMVYDTLLKREEFTPHPGGLSSLMFSFATFVIHSVFRTDFKNWNINGTSSYVDLAPLYGNDQAKQDSVRTSPKDGRGTLKPDAFAEDRLLFLPPGTCALLYIAKKLLEINERGTWADPATLTGTDEATINKRTRQDDEIFNIARLINAMWFAQVVFSDYFSAILGLVRDGSKWTLTPFNEIRKDDHTMVERGRGNSCSVEFNILYRWHPSMSPQDEDYIKQEFSQLFKKPYDQISPYEFGTAMGKIQDALPADPGKWQFGGLQRTEGGSFKDEDLANILKDATSRPAGAFGARHSPQVMRVIEVMGIEQARTWGVCSLNDFRRFLQLKPYATFEEWNPDPKIAAAARRLYGHIEYLELYAGLQAEQTIPVIPGAGLCPPFTVSRAILADAIALTRGDRFFTTDFTPYNLTAWGYQDVQRDTTNGGFGSTLGRLILRTLPDDYTSDNSYTWFPFMTPEAMKTNLTNLGIEAKYKFDRPQHVEAVKPVGSYEAVRAILDDKPNFSSQTVIRAKSILPGQSFLSSLGNSEAYKANLAVIQSSLSRNDFTQKSGTFFYEKASAMIKDASFTLPGSTTLNVDIVGDVIQQLTITYVSEAVAGLPLKTNKNPRGIYPNRDLQQMLHDVFSYIHLETDISRLMRAKELAKSHSQQLLHIIKSNLKPPASGGFLQSFFGPGAANVVVEYLQNLLSISKDSKDDVANDVFGVVIAAGVPLAQALVNVVDFYLDDSNAEHRQSIQAVVSVSNPQSDSILRSYVREALRLSPPIQGVRQQCTTAFNAKGVAIGQGHDVFLSILNANLDPVAFPNPTKVDPSRPADKYIGLDDALHGILTKEFVESVGAQTLRAVFSLKGVRRGPGSTGTLRRYLDVNRELSPWTKSMMIQYDA
ncbi:hypothetical protein Clacol_005153 [Clathrus columnatus]|uniref:Heme peroxidase n=1 Tax=Clathrus columnatus TaxID=1419009 RepID=A0AAV5ACK4_9AGAM|nr:hypothetical protein Clacol_005153 [Clathrus columnatus]